MSIYIALELLMRCRPSVCTQ